MASNAKGQGYMDQDIGPMLYQITFTCLGTAIVIVLLRLYSHIYLLRTRRLNLSEWLIIASTLLDIASCILIHFQIHTGMGKHIEYSRARPKMLQASMKVGLAQNSVYQPLIGVIKLSILAQLHVFAVLGKQQIIVKGTGIFVVVFTMFTTFGCWNMMAVNIFTSTVNTLLDFVIFILPFPTLVSLQMERRKKLSVIVTYCVGSLAIACSIVRLRNMIYFRGVGDFTYVAAMVPIWGATECNGGIICASFPFLMPLFKCISGSTIGSCSRSRPYPSASEQNHEMQGSGHQSGAPHSKHLSRWQRMESESIEQINDATSDVPKHEAGIALHRVEHIEDKETTPTKAV